jgi:hypothetical protein
MGDLNRTLSLVTTAAVLGLFVLNWQGTAKLIQAIAAGTVDYVSVVQGRGFPGALPVRQGAYPS